MKYAKETKVALTAIAAVAVLYYGLKYIKGIEAFSSENQYYIYYSSVDALEKSSPVTINGFVVGRVTKLKFVPSNQPHIEVEVSISEDIALPEGTVAELQSNSILGGKAISLWLPKEGPSLNDGDTLVSRTKSTLADLLGDQSVQNKVSGFISNFGILLENLSTSSMVLDKTLQRLDTVALVLTLMIQHNQIHVNHSVEQISLASTQINQVITQVDSLLMESRQSIKTLQEEDISPLMRDLRHTIGSVNLLMDSLNAGRGTLGKLLTEDELYHLLTSTLHSLQTLSGHLDRRPKDFLSPFGRSEKRIARRTRKKSKKSKESP